jgi:hypothetical protein
MSRVNKPLSMECITVNLLTYLITISGLTDGLIRTLAVTHFHKIISLYCGM